MKAENLDRFIDCIGLALMMYSREAVTGIEYVTDGVNEYADIKFQTGSTERVVITGNSCLAATRDIVNALM